MSDLRTKQPKRMTLDLTGKGGGDLYTAVIETWTYSSIKNEDVFTRELTINFSAETFRQAFNFADDLATVIALAHDVFQSNVRLVAERRFVDRDEDAGQMRKPKPKAKEVLPEDVKRLVIAARTVAFGPLSDLANAQGDSEDAAAIKELDKASEAFASRIDWEDQPEGEDND